MNRNSKKGFTIVELIIVIAVIAVLAAVLIPTFSNLIQKAQEAKDTALVRNLNEALAMDVNVSKHTTMDQVAQAVRNNGIDIAKIKASVPGNAILWDSVNDLFAYCKVDKDGNAGSEVYYIPEYSANAPALGRLFAVVSDSSAVAASKYGVYYIGSAVPSLEINGVGFDAGDAEVGEVIYNGSSSGAIVDIRTNGGKLTIKGAGKDDVNHHGVALGVTIEEVKESSYHEYGEVQGNIELKKGHVVLENTAKVGTIIVNPTASAIVSVGTNGGTVGAVVKKQGVTATIDSKLPSQEITQEQETEMNKFAGGIGTEASPYLIEDETQFRNIDILSNEMKEGVSKYFKLVNNIVMKRTGEADYITDTFTGLLDGNGHSITLDVAPNCIVTGQDGGYGTFWFCDNTLGETEIRDLTILHSENSLYSMAIFCNYTFGRKITLNNVDIGDESVIGKELTMFRNCSSYFLYARSDEITMVGCDNYYNMRSDDGECMSALYVGAGTWSSKLTIKDSVNYGNLTAAYVGLVIGNPYAISEGSYSSITLDNVVNKGTITYFTSGSAIGGNINYNTTKDGFTYNNVSYNIVNKNYIEGTITSAKDGSLALNYTDSGEGKGKYSVTEAQNTAVVSYKVLITAYAKRYEGEILDGTQRMPIYIDLNTLKDITGKVYLYGKEEYTSKYSKEISSWKEYELMAGVKYAWDKENNAFVFDFSSITNTMNYTLESAATLYICAYDSTGTLIALAKAR